MAFLMLILASTAHADPANTAMQAFRKLPSIALTEHNTQVWFWRTAKGYGIDKAALAPLAIIVAPLMSHHVSSKNIAAWSPLKGLTIHPDLDYCLTTDEKRYGLTVKVGW